MKVALIVSLVTASLTYFALSRWMPDPAAEAPIIAAAVSAPAPAVAAPMKTLALETVQVSHTKYFSSKHAKHELSRHSAKPHAEVEKVQDHVIYAQAAPIVLQSSELDLSLAPSVIILPKAQLTRVAPLILQKKNPS